MNVKNFSACMVAMVLAFGVLAPTVALAADGGGDPQVKPLWTSSKQVRYPAEGGTWTYGNYGDFYIHSDYYHATRNHASSCKLDGTVNKSICTAPKYPSKSQVQCLIDTPWTVDEYYYKLC